jgi:hypothetical protein
MKTPKYYYRIVHDWINLHYGKAHKCENPICNGKSKTFEYCLKKGKQHERNIENYFQLCRSCHRLYDMTPESKVIISGYIAGKFNENLKLGPIAKQKRVILIDENKTFNSGQELATYLGSNKASVYMVANGKRKSLYGHKIRYADN